MNGRIKTTTQQWDEEVCEIIFCLLLNELKLIMILSEKIDFNAFIVSTNSMWRQWDSFLEEKSSSDVKWVLKKEREKKDGWN